MQTFLPYESFIESARCLDRQRLGKQRVEAKQILFINFNNIKTYAWYNHPATKMWRGYEYALACYGMDICAEWINRGYEDNLYPYFYATYLFLRDTNKVVYPFWLGNEEFHASHRSNLLRKYPMWYNKFGWKEANNLPYIWPVK